jgi:hypothetical protein
MNIDYGKIVTNALSALVATVFVGAAVIVWNAATTIDQRIEEANSGLRATQESLIPEVADVRTKVYEIENQLRSLNKILSESEPTRDKVTFNPEKPFILEPFKGNATMEDLRDKESKRIRDDIDVRQMQLVEKR